MDNYIKRFKNTGTLMSLVGLVGLLLLQFGIKIDLDWLNATANLICSILVILGVCNNPETVGVDLPQKQDNKEE